MEKMETLKAIRDKISQNLVLCESENKDLEKDDLVMKPPDVLISIILCSIVVCTL
jgi:hypothetical protein